MAEDALICSDATPRDPLQTDCSSCKGLCCILLPFDADQGFPYDKAAGMPCSWLTRDSRCAMHPHLAARGFTGCRSYDCHGAGQYVTALLRLGNDWHESEVLVRETYAVFAAARTLHALLKARTRRQEHG